MKALFFFLLFGGGDWVGNSLGHSERMIQLAFENLDIYLVSSLVDSKQPACIPVLKVPRSVNSLCKTQQKGETH